MSITYIVRTHGGLGNQLFQIFYAILLRNRVSGARLAVIHDSNYGHRFELDKNLEVAYSSKVGFIPNVISKARIPKVISKLCQQEIGSFGILNYRFLDGYFQNVRYYGSFDDTEIMVAVNELKRCLVSSAKECDKFKVLYHFRLLDFFRSESEELKYIETQFSDIPAESSIVSNNDNLFRSPEIQKFLDQKNINHIESDGLSSVNVLLLMMEYGTIHSNNSTLAFWAAIFNRCELNVGDDALKNLYNLLLPK
jgi:hypothetical protein|tara:strand:+ start:14632 stop:15387 length:756 start_codon:yes stop_codon:yes gene_type:complete